MLIRPASMADFTDLAELYRQVDQVHREGLPSVFRAAAESARSPEYLEELLADSSVGLLVAERGGRAVGLVHVQEYSLAGSAYFVPCRYAQVRDLVVHEESRGQGLGTGLMAAAEGWARSRGISEIRLMVWEFGGSALPFYRSLGYGELNRTMTKRLGAG